MGKPAGVSGRRTLSWKEMSTPGGFEPVGEEELEGGKDGFWMPRLKGFFTTPLQTSGSNLAAEGGGSSARRGRVEGRTRGEHTLALNWSFPSPACHQAINSGLVMSPWHLYLLASLQHLPGDPRRYRFGDMAEHTQTHTRLSCTQRRVTRSPGNTSPREIEHVPFLPTCCYPPGGISAAN